MSLPASVRSAIPLLVGLAIGGVGATLFLQSMPGEEGSPEERANKLEAQLKSANNRITSLEAADPHRRRPGRTLADGARSIAEDIREGRPISPDDIFHAMQPFMRDLSPLFDRMRVHQQKQMIDSMTGELARKYDLNPAQQESLKNWFREKAERDAKAYSDLVAQDGTRLEDVMKATANVRPDDGLDEYMGSVLSGDKLAEFKSERMTQRAERVQQEADRNVQRLDNIVHLDDTQRDQVFGIMARGSRDYDPGMKLEGVGGDIGSTPGGNRNEAMLRLLRPEQREAYEAERQQRRDAAEKDMQAMGLTLPPTWNLLDEGDFR